jgi:hypothetical protein
MVLRLRWQVYTSNQTGTNVDLAATWSTDDEWVLLHEQNDLGIMCVFAFAFP